jgi:hypothetical protein
MEALEPMQALLTKHTHFAAPGIILRIPSIGTDNRQLNTWDGTLDLPDTQV